MPTPDGKVSVRDALLFCATFLAFTALFTGIMLQQFNLISNSLGRMERDLDRAIRTLDGMKTP